MKPKGAFVFEDHRTRFIYFAMNLDFGRTEPEQVERVRTAILGAGLAAYVPGTAFAVPSGASVGPVISEINNAAVDACEGLVALLTGPSIGVPREIERAKVAGKPVLIVTTAEISERSWALAEPLVNPDYRVVYLDAFRERDTRWLGIRIEQNRNPRKPVDKPVFFVVEEGAKLPTRSYEGDAGFDLYTAGDWLIQPGDNLDIPCGVSCQLPEGVWAMITGRSSTVRKLRLQVQSGVIDQGYRGPLYANVQNLGSEVVELKAEQRIAQLIPFPLVSATLHPVPVDVLAESDRGIAGFGSSGV